MRGRNTHPGQVNLPGFLNGEHERSKPRIRALPQMFSPQAVFKMTIAPLISTYVLLKWIIDEI